MVDVNAAASTADNDDDNDPLKGLAQLAGPPVVDVTGVTDVAATTTTAPPSSSPSDLDLKVILQISSKIKDKASRERALLMALRNSRRELEDAESANNCATHRLAAAKEVYTICAQFLAGYTPLENRIIGKKKKKKASTTTSTTKATNIGGTESNIAQIIVAKRIKLGSRMSNQCYHRFHCTTIIKQRISNLRRGTKCHFTHQRNIPPQILHGRRHHGRAHRIPIPRILLPPPNQRPIGRTANRQLATTAKQCQSQIANPTPRMDTHCHALEHGGRWFG